MDLMAQTEKHEAPLVCYGKHQTSAALRIGAVQEVLISATPAGSGKRWMTQCKELAMAVGASLVKVSPQSDMRMRFCEGIVVGAFLRYAVDPVLLEADAERDDQEAVTLSE